MGFAIHQSTSASAVSCSFDLYPRAKFALDTINRQAVSGARWCSWPLTIDRNVADFATSGLDEFLAANEHAARAEAGVIDGA